MSARQGIAGSGSGDVLVHDNGGRLVRHEEGGWQLPLAGFPMVEAGREGGGGRSRDACAAAATATTAARTVHSRLRWLPARSWAALRCR